MGISYQLNELDEIVSVSKGWTRFALANDAPDLVPEKVLNRPLWDFITDLTTEQLYRQILKRVRSVSPCFVPFCRDCAPARPRPPISNPQDGNNA